MRIGEYFFINSDNLDIARKDIDRCVKQNKKIIVLGQNDEFNRKILENKNVHVFIPQFIKKNSLKHRATGLNQVLCKLALKNEIKIGIDINFLRNKKSEISEYLSKIMEIIRLCKKYKNEIILINPGKNKHDLFSFLLSLGMPTYQAKYAVENSLDV